MALSSYLTLTAATQGVVHGSVEQLGREGSIEVIGFSHEVNAPRDSSSGLPTGKRQHKPFSITKPLDRSTPLLQTILSTNESIVKWRLECWRPSATGQEEQHYTVELENANISQIRQEMLNNRYPRHAAVEIREHVHFTYEKIAWTWEEDGIIAIDDWQSPV